MESLSCSEQRNHVMNEGIHHLFKGARIDIKFSKGGLGKLKEENQLRCWSSSSDRNRAVEIGIKGRGQTRVSVYSIFIDHKKLY